MLFAAKPNSRRPRKAGAKRVTAAAEPPRKPPLLLTVLALALVVMCGYGLYSIKGLGDQLPETAQAAPAAQPKPVQPATKPSAKPQAEPLPQQPVEEWRYIEVLENKTVEVEVPEPDDTPTRPYLMQCGSFRKQDQANSLKAKIAFSGLHSEVRRSEGSNGVWYRVVLGPYDRKRDAERDRHKLARSKISGCQIWFWS